jgi:hypothetical protein
MGIERERPMYSGLAELLFIASYRGKRLAEVAGGGA